MTRMMPVALNGQQERSAPFARFRSRGGGSRERAGVLRHPRIKSGGQDEVGGRGLGVTPGSNTQGVRPTTKAPTTMLRMVPLPRAAAQGRKGADASPPPCSDSETGEGDHPKGGGGGAPRDNLEVTMLQVLAPNSLISAPPINSRAHQVWRPCESADPERRESRLAGTEGPGASALDVWLRERDNVREPLRSGGRRRAARPQSRPAAAPC